MNRDERAMPEQGADGPVMWSLLDRLFVAGRPDGLSEAVGRGAMDNGAVLRLADRWLVITTGSHVVHPIFFPGGDIGRMAVTGTVNGLAMLGATEVTALTCAMIIEEGFGQPDLERIQRSIRETCREAGARVVTGDTKLMGKGELDGIVINTTGFGLAEHVISDSALRPGDRILVTGTIGDHGIAVLAARHGLDRPVPLASDVAPLNDLIRQALRAAEGGVTAMKNPRCGGLSRVLNEMATKSGVSMVIDARAIPVTAEVRAVGERLGIDPLHAANEGKAVLGVRAAVAERVLGTLRVHPQGTHASIIGVCGAGVAGTVALDTGGGRQVLSPPAGRMLPSRTC